MWTRRNFQCIQHVSSLTVNAIASSSHHSATSHSSFALCWPFRLLTCYALDLFLSPSYRHHDHCVLFTGTKGQQHAIHYWSLYDNKLLRKFRGHSDKVVEVSMSPADDMFLTASKDRTVRLWNVQQAGCVGQMDLPYESEGDPHVVFDSTGMVFAVMAGMAGKQGNVSSRNRENKSRNEQQPNSHNSCPNINYCTTNHCTLSIFTCMMLETTLEAPFLRWKSALQTWKKRWQLIDCHHRYFLWVGNL